MVANHALSLLWYQIYQIFKNSSWYQFLDSISKIEADTQTISNAAGPEKQVGESWTDKIMGFKSQGLSEPDNVGEDEAAGADDDEWVSIGNLWLFLHLKWQT